MFKKNRFGKKWIGKTFFGDEYSLMFYDLFQIFFENEMLKEYYEMIVKYNTNLYDFDEGLIQPITNIFLNIDKNKIYYLINETANFALKQESYELMKFIVDKWNTKDCKYQEMSSSDIEKTVEIIDSLNKNINKSFTQ